MMLLIKSANGNLVFCNIAKHAQSYFAIPDSISRGVKIQLLTYCPATSIFLGSSTPSRWVFTLRPADRILHIPSEKRRHDLLRIFLESQTKLSLTHTHTETPTIGTGHRETFLSNHRKPFYRLPFILSLFQNMYCITLVLFVSPAELNSILQKFQRA